MKTHRKDLRRHNLETVAEAILGPGRGKVDISYKDQFDAYMGKDLDLHVKIAQYVYTDAKLVPEIATRFQ